MQYNTSREILVMKEYGRHIQKMVDYVVTIEDRNERQEQAHVLIELMGFLNPHLRNVEDFRHKLWDHLFYMSGFKLDVDSPYPIPTKENYKEKPNPLPYPNRQATHAHLGRNLDTLIDKALEETDPEKREWYTHTIIYYIKLAYATWHKEQVSDESIISELKSITKGQLQIEELPNFKYKPSADNKEDKKSGSNKRISFTGKSNSQSLNKGQNKSFGNSNRNVSNGNGGRNGSKNTRNNNFSNAGGFKKRYK